MGAAAGCLAKEKKLKISKGNTCQKMMQNIVGGYSTKEGKCELMGFKYCNLIDSGELTLEKALDDILEYTRIFNMKADTVQDCWLLLHLCLGLCFQYKTDKKELFRKLLLELLPYSRGIDMGLFMRDLIHYADLTVVDKSTDLEKTLYCVAFCGGFTVDLEAGDLGNKLFKGPARVVYKDLVNAKMCCYLDIPLGHPTLMMTENTSSDNHIGTQPLTLAFESLRPEAVLMLIRHGASPRGRPFERLLEILGSPAALEEVVNQSLVDRPMDQIHKCLTYCLRAIKMINICFDPQTVGDLKTERKDAYFVRESAAHYLPDDRYKTPCALKHFSRCAIREILMENDSLPSGIAKLPNLSDHLRKYVDLLC